MLNKICPFLGSVLKDGKLRHENVQRLARDHSAGYEYVVSATLQSLVSKPLACAETDWKFAQLEHMKTRRLGSQQKSTGIP